MAGIGIVIDVVTATAATSVPTKSLSHLIAFTFLFLLFGFQEDLFLDEFGIQCEKADNSEKCHKTRVSLIFIWGRLESCEIPR